MKEACTRIGDIRLGSTWRAQDARTCDDADGARRLDELQLAHDQRRGAHHARDARRVDQHQRQHDVQHRRPEDRRPARSPAGCRERPSSRRPRASAARRGGGRSRPQAEQRARQHRAAGGEQRDRQRGAAAVKRCARTGRGRVRRCRARCIGRRRRQPLRDRGLVRVEAAQRPASSDTATTSGEHERRGQHDAAAEQLAQHAVAASGRRMAVRPCTRGSTTV